jgi:glycosyltransferase involved in cell wall biosynthesis
VSAPDPIASPLLTAHGPLTPAERAMLPWIPLDARRLAGTADPRSALLAHYRARNPAATYRPAGEIAAAGPPFDAVLAGDWPTDRPVAWLRAIKRRLADRAVVLACVANAAHPAALGRLLAGAGPPAAPEVGAGGLSNFAARAGYALLDARPVPPAAADAAGARARAHLAAAGRALGVDADTVDRATGPAGFLLRLTAEPPRRTLVQGMSLRPQGAVTDVRMDEPLAALASRPEALTRADRGRAHLPRLAGAGGRVFVWQRPILSPDDLPQVRKLIDRGYVVVTDFDDDPDHWPEIARHDHLTFRAAHAVQTSTPALAARLAAHNPTVQVFANSVSALPPPPAPTAPDAPVRLFFGALNRKSDWTELLAAVNGLLQRRDGELHVEVVHDRAFFDALATDAKTFTPTCDYAAYKAVLQRSDLALMPLAPTAFNRMKSDLKFVEAAAHGAVALASPTVYADSIRDRETGLICDTPAAFAEAIEAMLDRPDRRQAIAEAAYAWVRDNRMLAYQVAERMAWYRDLVDRRDALTRALRARVPGLEED